MFERINEFDWTQAKEKYSNYDKWPIPLVVQEKGLTFLTGESIERLIFDYFVLIGGDRSRVITDSDKSLSLEYECRKDNNMAKILTEEMQKEWLPSRNAYVTESILSDIRRMRYSYATLYGAVGDGAQIKNIETLYVVYPFVNILEKCTNEEIYGFALAECRKYKLPYFYMHYGSGRGYYRDKEGMTIPLDCDLSKTIYGNKYNCLLKKIGPSSYNASMAYTQRCEIVL